jgi:hypothetical protein
MNNQGLLREGEGGHGHGGAGGGRAEDAVNYKDPILIFCVELHTPTDNDGWNRVVRDYMRLSEEVNPRAHHAIRKKWRKLVNHRSSYQDQCRAIADKIESKMDGRPVHNAILEGGEEEEEEDDVEEEEEVDDEEDDDVYAPSNNANDNVAELQAILEVQQATIEKLEATVEELQATIEELRAEGEQPQDPPNDNDYGNGDLYDDNDNDADLGEDGNKYGHNDSEGDDDDNDDKLRADAAATKTPRSSHSDPFTSYAMTPFTSSSESSHDDEEYEPRPYNTGKQPWSASNRPSWMASDDEEQTGTIAATTTTPSRPATNHKDSDEGGRDDDDAANVEDDNNGNNNYKYDNYESIERIMELEEGTVRFEDWVNQAVRTSN